MLAGAMLYTSLQAVAQSSVLDTPRTFTSYQNIDLYNNMALSDTFQITLNVTNLSLTLDDRMRELAIQQVQGSWTVFQEDGALTFDIPIANITGKGKLQREAGVLSLTVDLSQRADGMKQKFILINP